MVAPSDPDRIVLRAGAVAVRLRAGGATPAQVATALAKRGVTTRNGTPFTIGTVSRLLQHYQAICPSSRTTTPTRPSQHAAGIAATRANADAFAMQHGPMAAALRDRNLDHRQVASAMHAAGVRSRRGRTLTGAMVRTLLRRYLRLTTPPV